MSEFLKVQYSISIVLVRYMKLKSKSFRQAEIIYNKKSFLYKKNSHPSISGAMAERTVPTKKKFTPKSHPLRNYPGARPKGLFLQKIKKRTLIKRFSTKILTVNKKKY